MGNHLIGAAGAGVKFEILGISEGLSAGAGVSPGIRDSRNLSRASTVVNERTLSQNTPSATLNYTLDNLGRATTISNSISGLTLTVAFAQAFDAAGNRTELKTTIGSTLDFKNTYQYDALNRLVETIQQGQSGGNVVTSKRVTQSYNSLSQRTGIGPYQSTGTSNLVVSTNFSFDTANRLTNIVHAQGSTTQSSYAYTYDDLSRIASISSSIDGLSTYAYDDSSQLTGADHSSQTDESYNYDDNGNETAAVTPRQRTIARPPRRVSPTPTTMKAIAPVARTPEPARCKSTLGTIAIVSRKLLTEPAVVARSRSKSTMNTTPTIAWSSGC